MASTPLTKTQETQTPPPPSSRPGSAMSWADAVKSASRSATPEPCASPARPSSRAPSTTASPNRPSASAASPSKQTSADSRSSASRRSQRQQSNDRVHAAHAASSLPTKSVSTANASTTDPSPAEVPPNHADNSTTTDSSGPSTDLSSASSTKRKKKKKKAKAASGSDNPAPAADPRLDPDLVALEEARQLAAIPVEHVEWAKRVIKLAERYTNRMGNTGPEGMRLTRVDDELYSRFRTDFPTLNIDSILQDELTGQGFAERWQALHADFADKLPAVYAHHLIRRVASREYADDNTMMATGAQFYAIEIARNREGANEGFYEALKAQGNNSK